MNPEDFSRDDLLREVNPIFLLGGILLCALLWLGTWALRRRFKKNRLAFVIPGFVLISGVFWLTFQLAGNWFALATSWSLIFLALLAGFAWELIAWIYDFEKSLVTPRRGKVLLFLRWAALVTLIIILLQPVRSFLKDREINREIAVLIDDSDSMHLSDQRLSPSEILDRAQLFGSKTVVENRPPLRAISRQMSTIKGGISREIDAIAAAPSAAAGLESRAESLPKVFEALRAQNETLGNLIETASSKRLGGNERNQLNQFLGRSRQGIAERLQSAEAAVTDGKPSVYILKLNEAVVELSKMQQSMDGLTARVDESLIRSLSGEQSKEVVSLGLKPRYELATHAGEEVTGFSLGVGDEGKRQSLLENLGERYNLRYYRFNRDVEEIASLSEAEVDSVKSKSVRAQTDLTGAIEHVLENSSPESLAGILLLSDGRHNAAGLPEDSLRQLAIQNSPLCAVPVGGRVGPVDSSILNLSAPESIYLDDRVVIKTVAKMDGLLGKRVKAELITDGRVVDEQTINVTDVNFRSEIRFVHTPTEKGIIDYQVKLEADPRELFKNNNTWDFKVAVTDDRTNVLLVDGYPRWEFRYLRNLFYGRDKSVHLQYVLLNPDTISGMRLPAPVAASATRKFGDAEATQLPKSADEWQLFDVIILGDIEPNQLSNRDWKAIEEAVTKRGAMLVCVAGPRYMPHDYESNVLKDLLPVTFTEWDGDSFKSPEEAYKVELTAAGKGHAITSQSTSRSLNTELWAEFPPLRWRWQSSGVKEGAEVLAYADPVGEEETAEVPVGVSPDSIEAALTKLTQQKERENQNALISTMRSGLGKVVMMNFDRTWRFRYGVGDTYHHRFWGQMTRWGAGPNLRSGNEMVRVGTDRLSYMPTDQIVVTAKVLDSTRKPVTGASVFANVIKDGKRIAKQKLTYRSDSSGLYETTFAGFSEEGEYKIELNGTEIDQAVKSDPELHNIETELLVVTTRNPIELAELTANRDFLNRAARQTNGRVAELWELDSLLTAFGAPKETLTERKDTTLWDRLPLLLAFLGFLTTEWVLRRKSGLV